MWRKNQVCGCALIAFGLGLLVGMCLESGVYSFFAGTMIIGLGFWCGGRK